MVWIIFLLGVPYGTSLSTFGIASIACDMVLKSTRKMIQT